MNKAKFISEWFPMYERELPLLSRYENFRQLVCNDFAPESTAHKMLADDYGNDLRSIRIQYDYLEVENEVLIKCINSYCDANQL